jgi:membrane-bound lytic murein transglycosylase B
LTSVAYTPGVESAFGDPVVQQHHMRPVIPSLATLAWTEPCRRDYWEMELINALTIIQRGWSTPAEMVGSWAGAMGHVWTAPSWQGESSRRRVGRCSHVFGL